ncbi:uncharacterized protein LOC114243162 [Bombyx mandarina]|uniref:Uncharacterized protein LOC114243162 n=1 Tax=Bombyx mandarina TaxID=7092 RepID=A0A6J2JL58_BOMMA|nr:uncharacterized protein LOC114243162 [Bombyx mandarina]
MNALLDYGTSSSSSSDECDETEESTTETPKQKLPKPSLGESTIQTSVFSNPFVAAEQAKAAILEKHVKMVPGKDGMQTINGRKICWNHRKGRCRFGHNCKYAHDTDIQKTPEELEAEKQQYKSVIFEGAGTMTAAPPPEATLDPVSNTDDVIWEGGVNKKKVKRPGLSKNLIPNKKVIKMYKEQKARDGKKI